MRIYILLLLILIQQIVFSQSTLSARHRLQTYRYTYEVFLNNGDSLETVSTIKVDTKTHKSYIKSKGQKIWAENTKSIICKDKYGYFNGESFNGQWFFPIIQTNEYITYSINSEKDELYTTHIKLLNSDSLIDLYSFNKNNFIPLENLVNDDKASLRIMHKSNNKVINRNKKLCFFISTAASLGLCLVIPASGPTGKLIANILAVYGFVGILPTAAMYFTTPTQVPYLRLKAINIYTNKHFKNSQVE